MLHRAQGMLSLLLVTLAASASARAETTGAVRLLPADAEVAFSCNVHQLLEAPLLLKAALVPGVAGDLKKLLWDRPLRKRIQMLGLDMFKDVNRITAAGKVASGALKLVDELVVLEGTFKAAELKATARDAALKQGGTFKVSIASAVEVWEWSGDMKDAGRFFLAVLDSKTLLMTDNPKVMTAALAQAAGKEKSRMDEWLRATLEKADPMQTITCGFTPDGLLHVLEESHMPIQVRLVLPRNRRLTRERLALSVGLTFGNDLAIRVGMNTRNLETARRLRRRIDRLGLIGALVVSSLEDERLQTWEEVLRGLRVKAEGTTIFVDGRLSAKTVEKILKETHPQKALVEKP